MTAALSEPDHDRDPRRFLLLRLAGDGDIGEIAEGVQWSDGTFALRSRGSWPTTTTWEHGLEAFLAAHAPGGLTRLAWLDDPQAPEGARCGRQRQQITGNGNGKQVLMPVDP